MEERGRIHVPPALAPWKKEETHWTKGWVGPGVGLDDLVKSNIFHLYWDSNPRTVEPVS